MSSSKVTQIMKLQKHFASEFPNHGRINHSGTKNLQMTRKTNLPLTVEEDELLNLAISEYRDLFPRILQIPQSNFIPTLERFILISISKNINFPTGTISKILKIVDANYYDPDYRKINKIIQSIENIELLKKFNSNNYIPHCNASSKPIHQCGELMYLVSKNWLLCLKCKMIYELNCVMFFCSYCEMNYFTSIEEDLQLKYRPATWVKYHCNRGINDTMKCPKCQDVLCINVMNKKVACLQCKYEVDQMSIQHKCSICHSDFVSEAKIFNPLEFKALKIAVKQTIFDGIPAHPTYLPCCDLTSDEMDNYKFYHKKECNGLLYEGVFNKKKIVVCVKCHLINYADIHFWYCPICKERTQQGERTRQRVISVNRHGLSHQKQLSQQIDIKSKRSGSIYEINKLNLFSAREPKNSGAINKELYTSVSNSRNNEDYYPRHPRNVSCQNIQSEISDYDSFYKQEKDLNDVNDKITSDYSPPKTKRISYSKTGSPIKISRHPSSLSQAGLFNLLDKQINNININLNVNVNINEAVTNKRGSIVTNALNDIVKKTQPQMKCENDSNIKVFNSDDYTIMRQIGEGTFGKIYEVKDANGRKYAMKKILTSSQSEIASLTKEYEMLLSLSSYKLNLVNIHGMETKQLDKTTYVMYVLMDIAVRDWEKEIEIRKKKKNHYSEHELEEIIRQLIHTFAELQRHGISHRDIKPQNILLFEDGSFRISDFGEAKTILNPKNNQNTIKQTIRGTELYMSPILFHALQSKNQNDKYTEHNTYKSDVFSLGLCLLLASTLTFNALFDIRELDDMLSIKIALSKYLKGYSRQFTDILYQMIEIDEKKRFDFIELDKYIAGMNI